LIFIIVKAIYHQVIFLLPQTIHQKQDELQKEWELEPDTVEYDQFEIYPEQAKVGDK